ncbi:thiamine biosynthesis protein ApbE [Clostridiaceae bacterium 14S0207]|nr:thiamine biosynthesis protein ApbE [Clostridiaceae bacterium 14S0207]
MSKRKKKLLCISLSFILMCITLSSCTKSQKVYKKESFMLGTIISLKYYGKNGDKAIDESIEKIRNIENKMSVNIASSEICKVNNNSGKEDIVIGKENLYVIEKALEYSKLTGGAFDISIEPVVKLWGIGTEKARVPKKEEIEDKLKLVNFKDILIKNNKLFLNRKGMALDLGGIAKGYAADELKKVVQKYNLERAFINLGGNLYIYGGKENGEPLNIGIQDPCAKQGEYFSVLKVKNKSVVTSGNYERYFIKNGKRYHHILDPKTGYPAEKGLISTTIISDKSIDGDALSTSTYILGLEKGRKLIESLKGIEAIFVTKDKKVYTTRGINKENFNISNKEYTYEEGR